MPELPEVETVRAGLARAMESRRIKDVQVNRPDLRFPLPHNMATRLSGARVMTLRRRSKYILMDLSTEDTLIIHLGMSGRMLVSGPGAMEKGGTTCDFHHDLPVPQKHDHVVIGLDDGARITFNDARRFGAMDLVATEACADHRLLRDLGPEPLGNDFSAPYLLDKLKSRSVSIKSALLDQQLVAGLGNIYVAESLFRARINPRRSAGSLDRQEIDALVTAIRQVLRDAIAAGGSSLRDYRQSDGELGYFQHAFCVYDRAGHPCTANGCNDLVVRIVQSGRSSYYCPACQK